MMISSKKAEKKSRTAVRSADAQYLTLRRQYERPGAPKAETDYVYKMMTGALNEANKVRRANRYPPYGVSDEQWAEQRKAEKELRYRERNQDRE